LTIAKTQLQASTEERKMHYYRRCGKTWKKKIKYSKNIIITTKYHK
jgi:hypothetical protein